MSRNDLLKEVLKYFRIDELVCKHCYDKFGNTAWLFISTELLSLIYTLRCVIFKKPMIVNNWKNGGNFSQRGLRCNMCSLVKNKNRVYLSAHVLGKAIDFNVEGYTIEECKKIIRNNKDKFEYPIRLESNTTTWVHCDCYAVTGDSSNLVEFLG